MIFTKVEDLKYSSADNSRIDLFATCEELGRIPMTLNIVDTEDYHSYIDIEGTVTPLEEYCLTLEIAEYIEPIYPTIIPSSITMRQARLYLLSKDLLDNVEALVSTNKAWQIEWEYSHEVLRSNQLIQALQSALGLFDTDVDDMFLEASKL